MKDFLTALNGGRGEFDDWLECHSEKEIRDLLIPFVKQRDELLAALKSARRALASASANNSLYSGAYEEADEAIAKADLHNEVG